MKLTVKSASDLKRLALATGASVEHSGSKFNTTMERAAATKPAQPAAVPPPPDKPAPAPTPAPAPAKAQAAAIQENFNISLDMQPVADAVDAGNERVCKAITEAIREIRIPAQQAAQQPAPSSWTFKINRDARGFIESVVASPKP